MCSMIANERVGGEMESDPNYCLVAFNQLKGKVESNILENNAYLIMV